MVYGSREGRRERETEREKREREKGLVGLALYGLW